MASKSSSYFLRLVSLVWIIIVAQTGIAEAQSSVCRQLEQQLSRVSTGNFTSPSIKYRQYQQAIRDQRSQLSKTKRIARRNDCRAGRFNSSGRCSRLNSSIRQMQDNLAQLERTKDQLRRGGGNAGNQRNRILQTMQQRGCLNRSATQRQANTNRERPRRRSLIEQIFGRRAYREDGRRIREEFELLPEPQYSQFGNFRTMCVRTCDGYYFPISFSTDRDHFDADALSCESRCPGSEVELYYYGMPSQSPEEMMSYRDNIPYAQQPFAFNYRKKVDHQCSCNFSQAGLGELAELEAQQSINRDVIRETIGPRISQPAFRQDRYADPETASNKFGAFSMSNLEQLGKKTDQTADVKPGQKKKIRIVGPAFFPAQ